MHCRPPRVRTLLHSLTGILLFTAPWTLAAQGQPAWVPALLSVPGAALLALTWRTMNRPVATAAELPVTPPRRRHWRKTIARIRGE